MLRCSGSVKCGGASDSDEEKHTGGKLAVATVSVWSSMKNVP